MRVDFYQLGHDPLERVVASIAEKLVAEDARLVIVASDDALLARLDRMLWDNGPTGFLPHAIADGPDDPRQPILLATSPDAPNLARNLLIADGEWREAALGYDRAFYLFDKASLEAARLAWKLLSGRDGVDRRYWAQDAAGKWQQKA